MNIPRQDIRPRPPAGHATPPAPPTAPSTAPPERSVLFGEWEPFRRLRIILVLAIVLGAELILALAFFPGGA